MSTHDMFSWRNKKKRLLKEVLYRYSRLLLSRSKGLSEILRDIRISTLSDIRFAELRKKGKSNNHISQMNM